MYDEKKKTKIDFSWLFFASDGPDKIGNHIYCERVAFIFILRKDKLV